RIWLAFFMDWAATPALPVADSGRIRATFTCPLPETAGCCCGPAGGAGAAVSEPPNGLEKPAQADSKGEPSSRPIAVRRVAPEIFEAETSVPGLSGPTIMSLGLISRTDRLAGQHTPFSEVSGD